MWWELYALGRLQQVSQDASYAAQRAASNIDMVQIKLQGIEQHVDRLTLTTVALIEILRERHGVSDAELEAKMREIDMRDGRQDGRIQQQRQPSNCPACGRPNGPMRATCLYCGAPLPAPPIG